MNTQKSSLNLIVALAAAAILSTTNSAAADDNNAAAVSMERHNPYTVLGLQLRSNLVVEEPEVKALGDEAAPAWSPTLFQEIVPCRLVSTLEADKFASPWGPIRYTANETRSYAATGVLVYGDFVNPCSERIPVNALALSVRLTSRASLESGTLWISPGSSASNRQPALPFHQAVDGLDEANVLLNGGRFALTADAPTDLTVDVIGYFIPDPYGAGAKGDRGEQGPKGDKGDRGYDGAQGLKGDKGDDGAQGLKGDKGNDGAQGLKGDKGDDGAQGLKGDKGNDGAQGLKGDKGDKGNDGAQGLKGDKGDKGSDGAQGLKGDKGDKGTDGAQGLKGDKGDKGDKGSDGAQGLKGDKGDNGSMGPVGPMGPTGPQGPPGDDYGIKISMSTRTYMFPPPGNLIINDPNVTTNSIVLVTYVEVSNGNAIAVASVRNGSFTASGSPNKPFKYVVFTPR